MRFASAGSGAEGGEGNVVIAPGNSVQVLVATKPVDFRKGADGLAALVQESLSADPFCGAIYVFRAKRANRVKLLCWDGLLQLQLMVLAIAAARSTRRFHRLHCLRGTFDTGISYK
jgi:IS66 Orf2 like protein